MLLLIPNIPGASVIPVTVMVVGVLGDIRKVEEIASVNDPLVAFNL
ncbi:hypothetical protein AQBE111736_13935 [Aquirufa beregesia]